MREFVDGVVIFGDQPQRHTRGGERNARFHTAHVRHDDAQRGFPFLQFAFFAMRGVTVVFYFPFKFLPRPGHALHQVILRCQRFELLVYDGYEAFGNHLPRCRLLGAGGLLLRFRGVGAGSFAGDVFQFFPAFGGGIFKHLRGFARRLLGLLRFATFGSLLRAGRFASGAFALPVLQGAHYQVEIFRQFVQ